MSIKRVYNSPAMPQGNYNFALNTVYECEKVDGKYIIKAKEDKEFSLAFLKNMFKPCENYSWDMLEENKEKQEIVVKAEKVNKKAKSVKDKE